MKARRFAVLGIGCAVAAVVLSGCSAVSTDPSQIALHYSGGPLSSRKFVDCVNPSTRETHGGGEKYFIYPARQISFDATGQKGSEDKPYTVVSKDNAELRVPVTVTAHLNVACDVLKAAHERFFSQYKAWTGGSDFEDENSDGVSDGWIRALQFGIGKPLDTTLDRAAQGETWRGLWNDPAVKTALEATTKANLQTNVDRQVGGNYFIIDNVTVLKPDPVREDLKKAVSDETSSVAKANSVKAEADAKNLAAQSELQAAQNQAARDKAYIDAYGVEGWLKKLAIDKGISPWPNPVVAGQAPVAQVPEGK